MKKFLFIVLLQMFAFASLSVHATTKHHFTYEIQDGTAIITNFPTDYAGALTIPSTLDDYLVTRIGAYAFENCSDMTSVTIPTSVTMIGEGAFSACHNLKMVGYTGKITDRNKIIIDSHNEYLLNATWYYTVCDNDAHSYAHESDPVCSACGAPNPNSTLSGSHRFGDWEVTETAGCIKPGTEIRTCTVCGHSETRSLAAVGHKFDAWKLTKQATCTQTGTEARTCTVCGMTQTRPVSLVEHTFGGWVQTIAPDCTTTGQETRTCSACGTAVSRTLSAMGHHFSDWTQTKSPSCTAEGEQSRRCTQCHIVETKPISAIGHKFSDSTVTKAPTCTDTGIETGTCSVCQQETVNILAALHHQYGTWTDDTAPTCTKEGTQKRTCSLCGNAMTKPIPALGHRYGDWEMDKAATCSQAGTQKRTCADCNDTETHPIAALGHDFEDPTVVIAATISTPGLLEGKCKRCDQVTQQHLPCRHDDTALGIVIEAEEGVFAEGTKTVFAAVTSADAPYHNIQQAVAGIGKVLRAYTIDFSIAPIGSFTLKLPNPDELTQETLTVMRFTPDSVIAIRSPRAHAAAIGVTDTNAAVMDASVVDFTLDGTDIVISGAQAGIYAVIDTSSTSHSNAILHQDSPSPHTDWIGIVAGAVLVAVTVVILILIKNKKKAACTDANDQK